jgi:Fe-S cluster biogenesis protein NfuA
MADTAGRGLTDAEVREGLTRLDGLLEELEAAGGPVALTAMSAIDQLTEVYGTALGRVLAAVARSPELTAAMTADELLHHLFILHDIHPASVEDRVSAALEEVRRYARSHRGDVELAGIEGEVARVRLTGSCQSCHSSAATLQNLVTDAVLAAAPELARVEAVQDAGQGHAAPTSPGTLIPAEALLHKPATAHAPAGAPT